MPDNAAQPPRADDKEINIDDFLSRWFWANQLGISQDHLRDIVKEIGPLVSDVKRRLGKK